MTHPTASATAAPSGTHIFVASVTLFVACVGFGLVPFFSRALTDQGVAPHAVSFYRYIFIAVLLCPVLLRQLAQWRALLWGLTGGAVMGLGSIGYVTALETVPVSTVGVMYMTYPVFTMIIAWLLFSDRPDLRAVLAALIIVAAAVIAGAPEAVSANQLPALLLSLFAPIGFGFGICVLVHRLSRVPTLARMASVSLGAVLGLTPLMLGSTPAELLPPAPSDWWLILGIACVTAALPMLLYSIASPIVGTARSAVTGSIELPTFFLVGLLAFGEPITLPQSIACVMILGAIALSGTRKPRSVAASVARPDRA